MVYTSNDSNFTIGQSLLNKKA